MLCCAFSSYLCTRNMNLELIEDVRAEFGEEIAELAKSKFCSYQIDVVVCSITFLSFWLEV